MFKIFKYLERVIGHQGEGGLSLFLKKNIWATQFSAYEELCQSHTTFDIRIHLTKNGLKQIDQVLSSVFR